MTNGPRTCPLAAGLARRTSAGQARRLKGRYLRQTDRIPPFPPQQNQLLKLTRARLATYNVNGQSEQRPARAEATPSPPSAARCFRNIYTPLAVRCPLMPAVP